MEKRDSSIELDKDSLNRIVRKNAHFFAFLVLGILVTNALRRSGVYGSRSVLISSGDLFFFMPYRMKFTRYLSSRGCQVQDVLIGTTVAGVGIGLFLLIGRLTGK